MFLKKLIEKIKLVILRFLDRKKVESDNVLCEVSSKVWQAYKIVRTLKRKNVNAEDVLRYLKSVKNNADMMRYTDNPDVFMSNYTALIENIGKAQEIRHIDKSLLNIVGEISDIIKGMPKSYEEYGDDGLVYYSVTFAGKRKQYYYLSGNKTYKVGQYVIAPAGDFMEPAVVKIVSIERYTPTNAPMPPELLKTIISPAIK